MRQFYRFEGCEGKIADVRTYLDGWMIYTSPVNFSRGGMCFTSDTLLPVHQEIELEISIGGSTNFSKRGKVVWNQRRPGGDVVSGLRFSDQPAREIGYLQYLELLGKSKFQNKLAERDFLTVQTSVTPREIAHLVETKLAPIFVFDSNKRLAGYLDYKEIFSIIAPDDPSNFDLSQYLILHPSGMNEKEDLRDKITSAINLSLELIPITEGNQVSGYIRTAKLAGLLHELDQIDTFRKIAKIETSQADAKIALRTNTELVVKLSDELSKFLNLAEQTASLGLPEKIRHLALQSLETLDSGSSFTGV